MNFILVLEASTVDAFDIAFSTLAERQADALLVDTDPFFNASRDRLVSLAARYRVPAVYEWREFVTTGGLMSYGPSLTQAYRQIGIYAGKILDGANPAELPVMQPTKFELVVNLKTAKTLGLAIPQSVLARADEMIE